MKKRQLLLILLCVSLVTGANAQRHIRGIKCVDAGFGVSQYGSFYHAGYVMYHNTRLYSKANLFWEQGKGKGKGYNYSSIGLTLTVNYTVVPPIKERLFLNLSLGLAGSRDKLDAPINYLDERENVVSSDFSALKYGVVGGMETEYFLNDKFVLLLGWNNRFVLPTDRWGNIRWYTYTGIRFNF
jgi:hypothetical protein